MGPTLRKTQRKGEKLDDRLEIRFKLYASDGRGVLNDCTLCELRADIKGKLTEHPAANGLQLISRGFPLVTSDDYETAERAAFVYDSLYASIKQDLAPKVMNHDLLEGQDGK